ncbi:MAG: 50S ribosomal protein L11 [Eggerthellaceae bacterium]|nr:50S ribosomal protein L11 [Eggerthellaceae bacterium]
MADKKLDCYIKLQIPAGQASPAPPVGPALGAKQINIMQFCQSFNAQTQAQTGTIIPVVITVYEDKTFSFVCKTPPAAVLIKEKLKIKSGASVPQIQVAGMLTLAQLRDIAEIKMPDLNANTIEAAMEIIAGTARSMGVRIEGRYMKIEYKPSKRVAAILSGKPFEEDPNKVENGESNEADVGDEGEVAVGSEEA